jgi:2-C-methyl-D-erythritol 4-phosphate cytidylyltransferase
MAGGMADGMAGGHADLQAGPVAAVVVAAGRGTRMGLSQNKVFLPLCGVPVLARTLDALRASGIIDRYLVVVGPGEVPQATALLKTHCPTLRVDIAVGGADRQASVYQGLRALPGDESVILVHDGARPFVTPQSVRNCVAAARAHGAACVGMPVKDTIKRVDARLDVVETPDRDTLWQVQTPQGFSAGLLRRAHEKALAEGFRGTDDASLLERAGHRVRMVCGAYDNIKLTTPEDLAFAESWLGNT